MKKLLFFICLLVSYNLYGVDKFTDAYCKLLKVGTYVYIKTPRDYRIALTAECPLDYNPTFSSFPLEEKKLKYNFFKKECIGTQRIRFNTFETMNNRGIYDSKINAFFTVPTNIILDVDPRTVKTSSCVFDIRSIVINWL